MLNRSSFSWFASCLPVSWWVSSAAYGLAEAEPQLDRSRGPVMETGLVSGCSSAAFRGLMELKWTTERQPVKPREPSLSRSGSKSSEPVERGRKTARSGRRSASSLITADRLSLPEAHHLKLRPQHSAACITLLILTVGFSQNQGL